MKYGDYDNVTKDSNAIYDILDRQGKTLVLECIAERIGQAVRQFNLSDHERKTLLNQATAELREEIADRI